MTSVVFIVNLITTLNNTGGNVEKAKKTYTDLTVISRGELHVLILLPVAAFFVGLFLSPHLGIKPAVEKCRVYTTPLFYDPIGDGSEGN